MSQQDLMAYYEAQLAEARWAEEVTGDGLSRWRYTDENDIEWEGILSITALPGGAYFATLGVVVTSRGFGPSIENAYRVGNAVAQYIIEHWDEWQAGVPQLQD